MADYDDDNMWEGDEYPESPGDHDEEGDNTNVQEECIKAFASNDYIMEPGVFNTLKMYFKAGGAPEQVVQLLPDNYTAVAQTANLMAEWLIQAGMDIKQVQSMVETHLQNMIFKYKTILNSKHQALRNKISNKQRMQMEFFQQSSSEVIKLSSKGKSSVTSDP